MLFTWQYIQLYPCPTCHGLLPYRGVPHGGCQEGEVDEGFSERDSYMTEFHNFCEEAANQPSHDIFYRCATHNHVHIITQEAIDAEDGGMNDPGDMEEVVAEENEPDIRIIDENVEIIVIDSDEEDVMVID